MFNKGERYDVQEKGPKPSPDWNLPASHCRVAFAAWCGHPQAQFRKKKPHATYRYDSSLDPAISWDGVTQNI